MNNHITLALIITAGLTFSHPGTAQKKPLYTASLGVEAYTFRKVFLLMWLKPWTQ